MLERSVHYREDKVVNPRIIPLSGEVRSLLDVKIEVRDGTILRANLFLPAAEGSAPLLLSLSPYGKDFFGGFDILRDAGCHTGAFDVSELVSFEAPDIGFWVSRGFGVMHADTRGHGHSEGVAPVPIQTDWQDGYDLIEWAAKQEWSDGNVALCGVSYLSAIQWGIASLRPPHLRAIMPWEGGVDRFQRNFPGGIPETTFMRHIVKDWVLPRRNALSDPKAPMPYGQVGGVSLLDEFWQSLQPNVENINVPAFVCASFSSHGNHTRGTLEAYKRLKSPKWLFCHRGPEWQVFYSDESKVLQLAFFNRYLRMFDQAMDDVPPVTAWISHERDLYETVTSESWPLPETVLTAFWLDPAGSQLADSPLTAVRTQQINLSQESANFDIHFDRAFRFVGPAKLRLWISLDDNADGDLFLGIRKFDKNGHEVYFHGLAGHLNDVVTRGWLRLSHRELDIQRSSPAQPVLRHQRLLPMRPGDSEPVDIELWSSAAAFQPGERLQLTIQGRPVEPNPSLLGYEIIDGGRAKLHFGSRYDSHLLLPVLPQ